MFLDQLDELANLFRTIYPEPEVSVIASPYARPSQKIGYGKNDPNNPFNSGIVAVWDIVPYFNESTLRRERDRRSSYVADIQFSCTLTIKDSVNWLEAFIDRLGQFDSGIWHPGTIRFVAGTDANFIVQAYFAIRREPYRLPDRLSFIDLPVPTPTPTGSPTSTSPTSTPTSTSTATPTGTSTGTPTP